MCRFLGQTKEKNMSYSTVIIVAASQRQLCFTCAQTAQPTFPKFRDGRKAREFAAHSLPCDFLGPFQHAQRPSGCAEQWAPRGPARPR